MQAKVKELANVTIVDLIGRIDVEASSAFRDACGSLAQKNVVFNFEKLSFVGSNGIVSFVESIKHMVAEHKSQVKFCRVGLEFQKVFSASPLRLIETYEDEQKAVQAFLLNRESQTALSETDVLWVKTEVESNPSYSEELASEFDEE